jgi:hypothetical protein
MLQDSGFTDVVTGEAVDTFGGANGEGKARAFEVYGYAFMARRPPDGPAGPDRQLTDGSVLEPGRSSLVSATSTSQTAKSAARRRPIALYPA